MASMRTSDSRPAQKSSRGLRGACLEFTGFPAAHPAQSHSPCMWYSRLKLYVTMEHLAPYGNKLAIS
jgi:hypothetical protein